MSESDKPFVLIYTDGACSGNPGPGGWGAMLDWKGKIKEISGAEPATTNNRMEMRAIIEALKTLNRPCRVEIRSDSALIINSFRKGWIKGWISRGWRKADKKPVENQDLWKEMIAVMEPHEVKWTKVRGHSTDERNNRVDQLAVQACQKYM